VRRPLVVGGLLCVVAILVTGYWFFFVHGMVYSDDARIDGDLADMAPQINGTLSDVLVREGDVVKKGQILFTLYQKDLESAVAAARAAVDSAKADMAVKQAELQRAVNGPRPEEIREAEAKVKQLEAEQKYAVGELDRLKQLREKDVSSVSDLDKGQADAESAEQSRQEAEHQLNLLKEGTRPEDIEAAKAAVELSRSKTTEAESALRQAEAALSYADVTSPVDGVVVRRWMHPGEALIVGQPVLTVLNPATLHVSANIEETDLDRISIGDGVSISIDSYSHLKLTGKVEKILRATNSKFSLIPSEGVSGTFIKVVQRVPLWISLDKPPSVPIGPGLSVEVHIHCRTAKHGT